MQSMATKKTSNTHNSTAKKRSASSALSAPTKKAAPKRSQSPTKAKTKPKKSKRPTMSKKTEEMTLKMFQMVYEDYQKGKFHPIFHDSQR